MIEFKQKSRPVLAAFIASTALIMGGLFSTSAYAYSQPEITNYAPVPVTASIIYAACRTDHVVVPAATMKGDVITPSRATVSSGHTIRISIRTIIGTKHIKKRVSTARGACLITAVNVRFHGGNYEVNNYKTDIGTSYSEFGIYQRSAHRFRVMSKAEMKYEKHDAKMSPGFRIHNKSSIPLTISLDQLGCLYYDNLVKPGEIFDRNTGAVWFSIKAKVSDPGNDLTTWACAKPIVEAVVLAVVAVATLGTGDLALAASEGAVEAGAEAGTAEAAEAAEAARASLRMTTALKSFAVFAGSAALTDLAQANLIKNTSVTMAGQYAGPPYPFRSTHKPEYTITGGPNWNVCKGAVTQDAWDSCIITALTGPYPLKMTRN